MNIRATTDVEPSDPETKPLRIGVLCDAGRLAAWQLKCLAEVEQLPFARVVLLIRNNSVDPRENSTWRRLHRKLASGLFLWRVYERLVLNRRSAALTPAVLPQSLRQVPTIDVEPVRVGKFRQAFDDDALSAVRKHDVDVLLRFGFGILTGDILDVPTFGIWSFHHGDPMHFRGAPPGFWEIHNGAAVTGVILQRLTETLDGGVILHAGWFKTNAAWYAKSLDRILFGATHFVARALTELWRNPEKLMDREPIQCSGPIYRYPKTKAMLTFFARTTAAKIDNQWKTFFRHQQWSVGLLNRRIEALFEELSGASRRAEDIQWLPERPNSFLADPFPVRISGETQIIAEEFDWKSGRGRISTVPFIAEDAAPRAAIESRHHLSYPYVFEYGQKKYCVPECAESRVVALYRFVENEGIWIEEKQLISGFPALDPTIFSHNGLWWLFCTSAVTGENEFLYVWFSEDPTGVWTPHQLNPVKVDVRAARPAGPPFVSKGELIRPAQDCSLAYGGAIRFNRVLALTPEEFVEEPAGQLLPSTNSYSSGLHTISGVGNQTIVDGARLKFVGDEFRRLIRKKFGSIFGAGASGKFDINQNDTVASAPVQQIGPD